MKNSHYVRPGANGTVGLSGDYDNVNQAVSSGYHDAMHDIIKYTVIGGSILMAAAILLDNKKIKGIIRKVTG